VAPPKSATIRIGISWRQHRVPIASIDHCEVDDIRVGIDWRLLGNEAYPNVLLPPLYRAIVMVSTHQHLLRLAPWAARFVHPHLRAVPIEITKKQYASLVYLYHIPSRQVQLPL